MDMKEKVQEYIKTFPEGKFPYNALCAEIDSNWQGVNEDYITDDCYTVHITSLVSEHYGWKQTAKACEYFGLITAEQYAEIDNGTSTDEGLHDDLQMFEYELADIINAELVKRGYKGRVFIGTTEHNATYSYWYSQDVEEPEDRVYECPTCQKESTAAELEAETELCFPNFTGLEEVEETYSKSRDKENIASFTYVCPCCHEQVPFASMPRLYPLCKTPEAIWEDVKDYFGGDTNDNTTDGSTTGGFTEEEEKYIQYVVGAFKSSRQLFGDRVFDEAVRRAREAPEDHDAD